MSKETKAFMSETKVFCTFVLYFAHLALTFTVCKLGCTSAVQIKKMIFFFVLRSVCTNFASQFAIRNIGIYTYIYYNSI